MLVARGADIHAVGHVRRFGGWRRCGATGRVWDAHTTHRPATACWLACREPRACTSPRSTARRRSRSCWWLEELRLGTSALYVVCVPRGCPMCVCSLIHTVQEGNSPAREARLHGCVRCGVWVLAPIALRMVIGRGVCNGPTWLRVCSYPETAEFVEVRAPRVPWPAARTCCAPSPHHPCTSRVSHRLRRQSTTASRPASRCCP